MPNRPGNPPGACKMLNGKQLQRITSSGGGGSAVRHGDCPAEGCSVRGSEVPSEEGSMNEREQARLQALAQREGDTEDGRALRRLLEEWADWRDLITLGEAAGGLVHALNNHLNSMMLQA